MSVLRRHARRLKEAVFKVIGDGAFGALRWESGVHRVQRVPATESAGAHPHVGRDGRRAARSRGSRRRDRRQGSAHRRVPLVGPGRTGREHDRLRRAHHAPADRHRRQQQDQHSQLQNKIKAMEVLRARLLDAATRRAGGGALADAEDAGRHGRPLGEDPHVQLPAEPRHRSPHQPHAARPRSASWTATSSRSSRRCRWRTSRSGSVSGVTPAARQASGARVLGELTRGDALSGARRRAGAARRGARHRRGACSTCRASGPTHASRRARRRDGRATTRVGRGRRAARGAPFAYAVGRAAFRHLTLDVDERVLIPRQETEVLVDLVLEARAPAGGHRVDVGTGSGAIALALATEGAFDRVIATDVSLDALAVARANAGVPARMTCARRWSSVTARCSRRCADLRVRARRLEPAVHRVRRGSTSCRRRSATGSRRSRCSSGGQGLAATARDHSRGARPCSSRAACSRSRSTRAAHRSWPKLVATDGSYRDVAVRLDLTGRERFVLGAAALDGCAAHRGVRHYASFEPQPDPRCSTKKRASSAG